MKVGVAPRLWFGASRIGLRGKTRAELISLGCAMNHHRKSKSLLSTVVAGLTGLAIAIPLAAGAAAPAQASLPDAAVSAAGAPNGTAQIFLTPDMTGDGIGDLVQKRYNGELWLYPGNGKGDLTKPRQMGSMSPFYDLVFPGDWDGDGKADMIAIAPGGEMYLFSGNGKGGLADARQIGHGWRFYRVIPVGDLTGDGIPDLLSVHIDTGVLLLYTGNGKGGFRQGHRQVGHGWRNMELLPAGDLNRDGRNDILGVTGDGRLLFYSGKGTGTFQKATQVGHGWKNLALASGADLNRDGKTDIVGLKLDGTLLFYAGKGNGGFNPPIRVGKGFDFSWGAPDRLKPTSP